MVLAVIGVLCALCIPAYGDYTRRTYVSEGLVLEGSFLAANGKMAWECLSGDAASSRLGAARNLGASAGEPVPPEWAPASCRS